MLKKLLLIIILLTVISWLGTTGYLSYQTQQQLNNHSLTTKSLHIIHYKKGFTNSQLRFKLTAQTGNTSLNKLLHHVIFNADIAHGPIVYTHNGLNIASSHWQVNAEQASLPTDMQHIISKLLLNKSPFELGIIFNFNAQGHYQLNIPQIVISEFDQQLGTIAPSHFSGTINLNQQTGNIEGEIGEITIKNNNGHLHIPTTNVYADSKKDNNAANNIKRKVNLRTEKITYKSVQLPNDISFHLNLHIKQQLNKIHSHSNINLNLNDAITPEQMIKSISIKLDYQEPIKTTHQEQNTINKQSMMHMLLQQLEKNHSSLKFALNIIGQKGQVDLQATAEPKLTANTHKLQAHVSLIADKNYVDATPLILLLSPYIKRNVLLVNNTKYQFSASINGSKATLNSITLPDVAITKQKPSLLKTANQ
jgi:hypothetical protein